MNICIKLGTKNSYWEQEFKKLNNKYENLNISFMYNGDDVDLNNIDLFVSGRITRQELASANRLKALFVPFTGVNQLPLEELRTRNITVYNSHINANFVAEKAIALTFSLLGRVVELDRELRKGKWSGSDDTTRWTSLYNKKCGILGMGEIGQHIVNLLKPFNPTVVTLERYRKRNVNCNQIEYYDQVKEVCKNSDIIIISLPKTKETINMIDENILTNMKNKFIVNVGRAEVINEKALYDALKDQTLKGAALDVWYQYRDKAGNRTFPSHFPMHDLNNVVLSPHCSAHTEEARERALKDTIQNIERYITKDEELQSVNTNKGY